MDVWVPLISIGLTALVTWVGIPVTRSLSRRDARMQLKADCELYAELDDDLPSKGLLGVSIDMQVRELAALRVMTGIAREQIDRCRRQRNQGIVWVILGIGLVFAGVTASRMLDVAEWVSLIALSAGPALLIFGSYRSSTAIGGMQRVHREGIETVVESYIASRTSSSENS